MKNNHYICIGYKINHNYYVSENKGNKQGARGIYYQTCRISRDYSAQYVKYRQRQNIAVTGFIGAYSLRPRRIGSGAIRTQIQHDHLPEMRDSVGGEREGIEGITSP